MKKRGLEKRISNLKKSGLIEKCKTLALKNSNKPTKIYGFRTNTKYEFINENIKIIYYNGSFKKGEYLQVYYKKNLVLKLVEEEKENTLKIKELSVKKYYPGEWEREIDFADESF